MDPGCVPPNVVVHLYWMPRNLGFRDPSHAHWSVAAAVDLGLTAGGRIRGPRVRDLLGFVGKTRRREEGQGRMAGAARVGSAGSALYATDQGQGGKYGYTTACRWAQGRRRCTKWQESVYLGVVMVRLQLVEL